MKKRTAYVWILMLLATLLGGCTFPGEEEGYLVSSDETYEKTEANDSEYYLEDKASLYEEEDVEVVTMYLTVGMGNEEDGTNHTWKEINSASLDEYEEKGIEPYKCEAVLQVGDEIGPVKGEFGYGERAANATVQLRGQGASAQQQKSYRIRIKDGCGNWEDQKTISLNKHVADPVRFKNKLAYSLMQEIPQMLSCRTTFVHLYVKDKTEGEDGLFQDYGLYTQVEQVNKTYLKNRGFDNDGQLYQPGAGFDWERHEDSIMLATNAKYDQEKFEEYLEIGGSDEHDKITELLEAVNNPDYKISEIVEKYFARDNLYYWMAFHILTGNKDVMNGNYYIYSSRGSDKWYFISWDNDSILKEGYEAMNDIAYERSWNKGIFTFVDSVLFRRILQDNICRQELDAAIDDLYKNYLTEQAIQEKIDLYKEITEQYMFSLPDQTHVPVSYENFNILTGNMAEEIEDNYNLYKESMESAWPFHILNPEVVNDTTIITWDESYVFEGGPIVYTVEVATDYTFEECIDSIQTEDTSYEIENLEMGQYFVRIHASGDNGIKQDAYEYYHTEKGTDVYSTLCFYILEDGTAVAARFGEDG